MRENRFFVRSTDLDGSAPIRVGNRAAVLTYADTVNRLERLVGAEAASLFAEPVLPRGASGDSGMVSWYSAFQGSIVDLDDLDEVARRPVMEKLATRLRALAPALADPDVGPTLASWLNVTGPRDIVAIGGEPVLVNWGALPRSVATATEKAAHYAHTLGRFEQPLPPPPTPIPQAPPAPPAPIAPLAAAAAIEAAPASAGESPTPPMAADGARAAGAAAVGAAVASAAPRWRPWLAPLVATGLAAVVLLLLSLPGVLVYPAPTQDTTARDNFEAERLKASNDSLEAQLQAIEDALGQKMCRPENFSLPVPGLTPQPGSDGAGGAGGEPHASEPKLQLDPKPPEQAQLPQVPGQSGAGAATAGALLERTTALIIGFAAKPDNQILISQGSGFLIDDRHVITNHHVVESVDRGKIFVANKAMGGVRQAKIVALSEPPPVETDIRVDLAVLEIEPIASFQGLRLGTTPPRLATAYIAGFPGFLTERDVAFRSFIKTLANGVFRREETDRALSEQHIALPGVDMEAGRINNIMSSGSSALPILLHDMQLAKGNSGGPLIDACGRAIGVNTLLFSADAGTRQGNVAQDVTTLRKFLTDKQIVFVADDAPCSPDGAAASPTPQSSPSPTPSPTPSPAHASTPTPTPTPTRQ